MLATRSYELTPFQSGDYTLVAEIDGWRGPDVIKLGVEHYLAGPGSTLWYEGKAIACAGIVIPWDGLGHAWALISSVGRRHRYAVHRAAKKGLGQIIRDAQLRRVEAVVRDDSWVGKRWAQVLGFHEDGKAEKYGPKGEDFMRFVLYPEVR